MTYSLGFVLGRRPDFESSLHESASSLRLGVVLFIVDYGHQVFSGGEIHAFFVFCDLDLIVFTGTVVVGLMNGNAGFCEVARD